MYYIRIGFSILLGEGIDFTLDWRSILILIPRTLFCVVLDTSAYAESIVEAIVESVPVILAIVLVSLAASYCRGLKRSLSHEARSLILLNWCNRCWSVM